MKRRWTGPVSISTSPSRKGLVGPTHQQFKTILLRLPRRRTVTSLSSRWRTLTRLAENAAEVCCRCLVTPFTYQLCYRDPSRTTTFSCLQHQWAHLAQCPVQNSHPGWRCPLLPPNPLARHSLSKRIAIPSSAYVPSWPKAIPPVLNPRQEWRGPLLPLKPLSRHSVSKRIATSSIAHFQTRPRATPLASWRLHCMRGLRP